MKTLRSAFYKLKTPHAARTAVQISVFIGAVLLPVGIFHMICPYGGIATIPRLIQQGLFVPKTGIANLVILAAVLVATFIAGPVFCGWICPLGSIQDWIRSIARKAGIKTVRVPAKLDRVLSFIRFIVLVMIIRATALSFNLIFIHADPYYALMHFWTGEVAPQALIILGLTLVGAVFIERPWCRWFCPLGAVLSLAGRFSIFRIRKPSHTCISCGACERACPAGINPAEKNTVTNLRCIRCGLCEPACPPKLRTTKNQFRTPLIAALILIAVITAVLYVVPTSDKTTSGEHTASGTFEPKPQTSLSDLATGISSSLDDIYALLGLPADYDAATRLIDIEDDFEEKSWNWIQEKLKA